MNFVQWFKENEADLRIQHPDKSLDELTKIALNVFRTKRPINTEATASAKRKIVNDDEKEQSGISKLARFSFDKR